MKPLTALALAALAPVIAGCMATAAPNQLALAPGSAPVIARPAPAPTPSYVSAYAPMNDDGFTVPGLREGKVDPRYHRRVVDYTGPEAPGTIVVNTQERFLYLVEENGTAMRYGIGVGREGFGWSGTATIGRKAKWPTWTPPAEMIERDPKLAEHASGMDGGPENPLGARALYLYEGGQDTLYRLHGTNEPWSIGQAVSSGCIRMLNHDVIDLYSRVGTGTKVIVI
jgi:lipoprotein-anchoring transpeptidase ErfK/SrfK